MQSKTHNQIRQFAFYISFSLACGDREEQDVVADQMQGTAQKSQGRGIKDHRTGKMDYKIYIWIFACGRITFPALNLVLERYEPEYILEPWSNDPTLHPTNVGQPMLDSSPLGGTPYNRLVGMIVVFFRG